MALNICSESLSPGPTFHVDSVESDEHPLSNLLKPTNSLESNSFMFSHYVRCPVSLTIVPPFPWNLESIRIVPNVRSHMSSSFEFYIKSQDLDEIHLLSRCWNLKEKLLILQNNHFKGELNCAINEQKLSSTNLKKIFVPARLRRLLTSVTEIKIVITKTLNASIPSIGKLEIWGEPSKENLHKVNVIPRVIETPNKMGNIEDQPRTISYIESTLSQIPNELLDPITHSIMCIPMILPSGNIVDLSTIDRFNSEQTLLGRSPSDPFTGVCYTSNVRPIFAAELKTKIDEFVIKRSGVDFVRSTVSKELTDIKTARCLQQGKEKISNSSTNRIFGEEVGSYKRQRARIPPTIPSASDVVKRYRR